MNFCLIANRILRQSAYLPLIQSPLVAIKFFWIFWTWLEKNSNSKSNLLSWSPKSTWGYSTSDIGVGIDLLQGARLEDAEPAKTFNNTETGRLAYEFDESANITQLLDAGLIEMPDINMKIAKVITSQLLNSYDTTKKLGPTSRTRIMGLGGTNQILSKWSLWICLCWYACCGSMDFDSCTVSLGWVCFIWKKPSALLN